MTFVLSPQLDSGANPNLLWELYKSYLENNKKKIPESVFTTILNPNWQGGSHSCSPYMADVKDIAVMNVGTDECMCRLLLTKSGYMSNPIEIEILYGGLLEIDLPNSGNLHAGFSKTWRYNQFLICDGWAKYEVKGKYFTHQIEFLGDVIWSISANKIQVNWRGI